MAFGGWLAVFGPNGGLFQGEDEDFLEYLYPSFLDPETKHVWYTELYESFNVGGESSYFSFLQYILFLFLVLGILLIVVFFLTPREFNTAKKESYECGFDPFGDARVRFEVHFYIVGILFLLFDLEIVFLFPWLFSFVPGAFFWFNFGSGLLFLIILGIGFVYEWATGALDWSLHQYKKKL